MVIDHLTCSFQVGIHGLLGPNGAGKSTLMKLLCDQIHRDGGDILVDGQEILTMREEYRQMLGYMPQQQGLYGGMSAWDFLSYIAELKCIPRKQAIQQINDLLALFRLTNDAQRRLKTFSGGMKQRVMLSQALLGHPKYIILDEPTTGLDPAEQNTLYSYMANLGKECVILWSTHIVKEIADIANDIYLMKDGNIILQGTVEEVTRETGTDSLSKAYFVCMEG